jgi:hypothetical protein
VNGHALAKEGWGASRVSREPWHRQLAHSFGCVTKAGHLKSPISRARSGATAPPGAQRFETAG